MPRVLGVNCAGSDAYLAVIDLTDEMPQTVTQAGPERIRVVSAGDVGDSLARTFNEWLRVLAAIAPDAVVLLLPESDRRSAKVHSAWAPRCKAETLLALAAGTTGIPYDEMPRATVRSQLALVGKLDDAVRVASAEVVCDSVSA